MKNSKLFTDFLSVKQYLVLSIVSLAYVLILDGIDLYFLDVAPPFWLLSYIPVPPENILLLWGQIISTFSILIVATPIAWLLIAFTGKQALTWGWLPALLAALPLFVFSLQNIQRMNDFILYGIWLDSIKRIVFLELIIFLLLKKQYFLKRYLT